MKTLVTLFLFRILSPDPVLAPVDPYIEAMQEKIQSLYSAQSPADLQQAINALERIGQAEKTKWEPYYYSAFGYIQMATREGDVMKKDAYLDLAKTALDKSSAIRKDDSEVVTMEGFIYTIRVTVDPMTRGPQFAGLAIQTLQKALAINPTNPRAMMLLAQMQFGTAQFFKEAPTEACGSAAKAVELYGLDKSENPLAPTWGKRSAEELVKGCQ